MDILSWVIPIPLRNLFVSVLTGGLEKAPHILRIFLLDRQLLFWYTQLIPKRVLIKQSLTQETGERILRFTERDFF